MSETRGLWTITYGLVGENHFANIQIIRNRTVLVTRMANGVTKDEVEAGVAVFLESAEAKRFEKLYPALGPSFTSSS